MLLQVFLDQVVGGLFGLTEPSDDERQSVSQRLLFLSGALKTAESVETITTKHMSTCNHGVTASWRLIGLCRNL